MGRFRGAKKRYLLLSAPGPLGCTFMKHLTFAEGMELVDQRKAERLYYEDGSFRAFQMLKPERAPVQVIAVPVAPSSAVFSRAEHEAICGLRGPSRTAGLPDHARAERQRSGLPGTDFVERAQAKFKEYRAVH